MNACVFFFARLKYAVDYTHATDSRSSGFAIYGMAQACLEAGRTWVETFSEEGLLLIAGVKALLRA